MNEPILRVMTLNIGSLMDPGWAERRPEVVSWIDHVDPDIVCLQEVHESASMPNVAKTVAADASGGWHVAWGGAKISQFLQSDDTVRLGSAVLSRWPIEHQATHLLPIDESALTPEDPMPSLIPWELVYARTAGLDVFSTHLAPAPSHGLHRQIQTGAIDQIVREARDGRDDFDWPNPRVPMPAILCGDFNAEPESDEIRFLRGACAFDGRTTFWQDAWRVAGDEGPGYTQDWRTHPLAARLNVHRKRIDYVFVGDPFLRAGDAGRVLSAAVVCDEPRTGVQASDHLGVVAEILWPARRDLPGSLPLAL